MKAQLVVVQGKPEGKVIPLVGSSFKVGRGESCHLRPNSERVSREHAEFILKADSLSVRDLGSRNGTLVNGKALVKETCILKNRDLVQIGPLTFAVAIEEAPVAVATPKSFSPAMASASPDDVSHDDIDSWIVGAGGGSTADLPTTVQGGETLLNIETTAKPKSGSIPTVNATRPPSSPVLPVTTEEEPEEYEEAVEDDVEEEEVASTHEIYDQFDSEDEDDKDDEPSPGVDEFIDESNPFYAAKKALATPAANGAKNSNQDTSDVAHDILKRLMQQKKAARS